MLLLLLLLGCPRSIPPALEIHDTPAVVISEEPIDPRERLAWMLGRDPLARRPHLPAMTGDDPSLAAWVAIAARPEPRPEDWWAIEATWPGTLAVPLARGARLAGLEAADPQAALDMLLPLPRARLVPENARAALDCVGADTVTELLPLAERQVLLGWLDGPGIDVAPAAALLERPDWDRLSRTPAGAAVVARAHAPRDATSGATGRTALAEATVWALQRAAADRDTEQAALKVRRVELQARLGTTTDPAGSMLAAARAALLADAGEDGSLGLALVAGAAERLGRTCPDAPCGGLDRVRALAAAGRWGGVDVDLAVASWTLVALKEARDHLEVAYDEPSFPSALDEVVEGMFGHDTLPFDRGLLLQQRPGPVVHLAVARAYTGAEDTSKEGMFRAIDRALVDVAGRALAVVDAAGGPWAGVREPAERIRRRAAGAAGSEAAGVAPGK